MDVHVFPSMFFHSLRFYDDWVSKWLKTMRPNGSRFVRGIGSKIALQTYAEKVGKRWLHGMGASQCLFA